MKIEVPEVERVGAATASANNSTLVTEMLIAVGSCYNCNDTVWWRVKAHLLPKVHAKVYSSKVYV